MPQIPGYPPGEVRVGIGNKALVGWVEIVAAAAGLWRPLPRWCPRRCPRRCHGGAVTRDVNIGDGASLGAREVRLEVSWLRMASYRRPWTSCGPVWLPIDVSGRPVAPHGFVGRRSGCFLDKVAGVHVSGQFTAVAPPWSPTPEARSRRCDPTCGCPKPGHPPTNAVAWHLSKASKDTRADVYRKP